MSTHIKGLLSPRSEFGWSVGLLTVAPLVPLGLELLIKFSLEPSTVFLTATMYTLSIAFTSDRFWALLTGAVVVAALTLCFGLATAMSGASAEELEVFANGDGAASALISRLRGLVDIMYYVAFGTMTFFGYLQVRQRWQMHMKELNPFFSFRRPDSVNASGGVEG